MKLIDLIASKHIVDNDPAAHNLMSHLDQHHVLDVMYRTTAKQLTLGTRVGLKLGLESRYVDAVKPDSMIQFIRAFLDTDLSKPVIASLLGSFMDAVPGFSKDPKTARLCEELTRQGASVADDDESFNILLLGIYANSKGVPDRLSAFVSSTDNKMLECPIWEGVDFSDEDQIEKIVAALQALIEKHQAMPLQTRDLFTLAKCAKCQKNGAVMVWCEMKGGELEGRLRNACCPCQKPGEFL